MDLRPFTYRNFTIAVSSIFVCFGILLGLATVLPIYLQTSLGVTALVTGLVVMPGGVLQAVLAPFVGRFFDSHGPFLLVIPATVLMLAGAGLMITLDEKSSVWMVVATHVIFSLGFALFMTPMMTTALSSLPNNLYSHGSAGMTTLQQLAGATGTSVLVVFLTSGTASGLENKMTQAAATAHGASMAFVCATICLIIAVGLVPFVKRIKADPMVTVSVEPTDQK